MYKRQIDANELNQILTEIRANTNKFYEYSKKEKNFKNKIEYALRSLAYFYFLESIDEHSTLSDNIIGDIKNKYRCV